MFHRLRLAVLVLLAAIAAAALLVDREIENGDLAKAREAARLEVLRQANLRRARIESEVNSSFFLVSGLVSHLTMAGDFTQQVFDQLAADMRERYPNLKNIAAAPDMVVRFVYPREGNEGVLGLDYAKAEEQREMAFLAKTTGRPVLAGPVDLVQGGTAFIGRFPVYTHGLRGEPKFWGIISMVLGTEEFYRHVGLVDGDRWLRVALKGKDGKGAHGEVFFGDPALFDEHPVLLDVPLLNGAWQMAAVPAAGWPAAAPNRWLIRGVIGLAVLGMAAIVVLIALYIARLQESRAAAARENAMKSQFLANMSHEIRSPLHGILGILSLLEKTPLNDQQSRYIGAAQGAGNSLRAIVDDLFDLTRLEAGRLKLNRQIADIDEEIARVHALMLPKAQAKGLDVLLQSTGARPFPAVVVDRQRLRQVLTNLIDNAIKYTPRGQIILHYGLRRRDDHHAWLDLAVEDSGIGIAAENHGRLFERFEQIDNSLTRAVSGAGLGLAIVKDLVTLMGGEVAVKSALGKGATFSVHLPVDCAAAPSRQDKALPDGAGQVLGRTPRVLIVEDNKLNQMLLRDFLGREGFDLAMADDGVAALEALARSDFDLVLMDLRMPRMSGIEATRALRQSGARNAAVPIIALTANAMPSDRQDCFDAGMDDHVAKPIDMDQLIRTMKRHLARPGADFEENNPSGPPQTDKSIRLGKAHH
ncbi:MAG: response regulator [Pseudomonadota bacterium]